MLQASDYDSGMNPSAASEGRDSLFGPQKRQLASLLVRDQKIPGPSIGFFLAGRGRYLAAAEIIEKHVLLAVQEAGDFWEDQDLLFPTRYGTPMRPEESQQITACAPSAGEAPVPAVP